MKEKELQYAYKVLKRMHPLEKLPLEDCLPFVYPVIGPAKYFLRKCGLMAEAHQTNPEEEKGLAGADSLKDRDLEGGNVVEEEPDFDFDLEEGEDAMTRLGYGIVSYFNLIYTFMFVFLIITLVNIPVMYFNSSWHAFDQFRQLSWTAQYTAGNLGASEARCINVKLLGDSLSVSCSTGSVSEVTHWGVYKKDSEADQRSLCTSEGVSVSTGLDCASVSKRDHSFYTDKLAACIGQDSCLIHGVHDDIPIGAQPGDSGCVLDEVDSLFIQYNCKVGEDELEEKRHEALVGSCVNIFCALVLLAVVANRQGSIGIEKREFDLQTVTASDYTLELTLSEQQIIQARQEIQNDADAYYIRYAESDGLRLKLWMIKKLEDLLTQMGGEGGKVADVNFAYHNSWLLDALRVRGAAIKQCKWDELNEQN